MASASAMPMIAITKMLPNALGLRPTASAALPPTIPTPTPAPSPAKAKGKNGPKFPASAASIGRVSNIAYFLLFGSAFRSGRPRAAWSQPENFLVRGLASMISREFDIDGAKHGENEGLQQTDQ